MGIPRGGQHLTTPWARPQARRPPGEALGGRVEPSGAALALEATAILPPRSVAAGLLLRVAVATNRDLLGMLSSKEHVDVATLLVAQGPPERLAWPNPAALLPLPLQGELSCTPLVLEDV